MFDYPCMDAEKQQIGFILSTGRTGTKFMEKYINETFSSAVCFHEPHPKQIFNIFSNMYLMNSIRGRWIAWYFVNRRRKLWREIGGKRYIESNPYLYGCIEPFLEKFDEMQVLHIVRHPVSYMKSHINNGFWHGMKRFFNEVVPYWDTSKMVKDSAPGEDPLYHLIKRWQVINQWITSYQQRTDYLRIRFEDLFSPEPEVSSAALNYIRHFFGEDDLPVEENVSWTRRPVNPSHEDYWSDFALTDAHLSYLEETCTVLMDLYGYEIDTPMVNAVKQETVS